MALIFIPPLIGTYLFASAMMKTLMGLDSSAPELQTSPGSIALSMLLTTVIPTVAVVVLLISLIRYLALPKEV
ncbi:MAG: hypothetical protein EOP85_06535 [Verrucomicrobiaceae bacterium]|nr:MAG: hypothetical protein EOP85_06535 [Verrucomicrobiaceae bacterium]